MESRKTVILKYPIIISECLIGLRPPINTTSKNTYQIINLGLNFVYQKKKKNSLIFWLDNKNY